MFYLINEQDELYHETILVNTTDLKNINILTGSGLQLIFNYSDSKINLLLNKKNLFNITQSFEKIANLTAQQYSSPFILVTDYHNSKIYAKDEKNLKKVNKFLVNIDSIYLVFQEGKHNFLRTNDEKIEITETPEQVLQLIQEKIIHNPLNNITLDTKTVDNKTILKKQM